MTNEWESPEHALNGTPVFSTEQIKDAIRLLNQGGDAVPELKLPGFTFYDDIEQKPSKAWRVRNWCAEDEFSCIFGEPGSGKSVLVGDLSLSLAAGIDWHGYPTRPGLAVYVALERPTLVERRTVAWGKQSERKSLPFVIQRGPIDFCDKRTGAMLVGQLHKFEDQAHQKLALFTVDTVSQAMLGYDENSPKDMGAFVRTMRHVQVAFPHAHVQAVHHQPHDSPRLRGSGVLLGSVDVTAEVAKGPNQRQATIRKANDGPEGEQISFTLDSVTLNVDADGNATTAPIVVQATTSEPRANGKPKPSLSPVARIMLTALSDTVLKHGIKPPANQPVADEVPVGVRIVEIEKWRSRCYQRGIASTDHPDARRKAFQRALMQLAASQIVGVAEPFVWIART